LANNLYVAMTRARSMLSIFAYARSNPKDESRRILAVMEQCLNVMADRPTVDKEISKIDEFEDVLLRLAASIGPGLRKSGKSTRSSKTCYFRPMASAWPSRFSGTWKRQGVCLFWQRTAWGVHSAET